MTDPAALLREMCRKDTSPRGPMSHYPCRYCDAADEVDQMAVLAENRRVALIGAADMNDSLVADHLEATAKIGALRQRAEKAEAKVVELEADARDYCELQDFADKQTVALRDAPNARLAARKAMEHWQQRAEKAEADSRLIDKAQLAIEANAPWRQLQFARFPDEPVQVGLLFTVRIALAQLAEK